MQNKRPTTQMGNSPTNNSKKKFEGMHLNYSDQFHVSYVTMSILFTYNRSVGSNALVWQIFCHRFLPYLLFNGPYWIIKQIEKLLIYVPNPVYFKKGANLNTKCSKEWRLVVTWNMKNTRHWWMYCLLWGWSKRELVINRIPLSLRSIRWAVWSELGRNGSIKQMPGGRADGHGHFLFPPSIQ